MTNRDIIITFLLLIALLFSILSIWDDKERMEDFQKTIDNQNEMLYNKNTRIEELETQIQELENTNRELVERQKEVSRGSNRTITCEVSAYSSGDGLTPSAVMANGEIAYEGAVACNFLPFGTQVRINGNIYTVKDRCGIDNCIDIYMDSYEDCHKWGRRTVEVEIL